MRCRFDERTTINVKSKDHVHVVIEVIIHNDGVATRKVRNYSKEIENTFTLRLAMYSSTVRCARTSSQSEHGSERHWRWR